MTNANKARGDRWELAAVRYLQIALGRSAHRPHAEGLVDIGDIHVDGFVLQAKDEARHTFSKYVDDAERQAIAAGVPFGAAVVKRRRAGTDRAYVVMSLATFRRVLVRMREEPQR